MMWIHVPNSTSSVSVADTEESNLDCTQPWLEELARSATWKTKSVPHQFLRRVWKTVPSIQRLSGLTSEPSIQNRGVDSYRSWLAAFHVSPSVLPVNASNRQMKETSGPMSPESSTASNPTEYSWKMFQASCGITMNEFGETYERWLTRLRKDSSRRQKQALLTRENGSSSWPTQVWMTPNTMDSLAPKSQEALDYEHDTARQGRSNPNNLRDQAAVQEGITNWPAPTTAEAGKISNRPDYGQQGLSNHPAIVGKPNREKMTKSRGGEMGISTNPDSLSIPQAPATKTDGHTCSPSCRRLNPRFAEMLMGLPPGWTDDSAPLATASFQRWQRRLSENLAGY